MPDLPPRADLDQLRRQAKDLLREARGGSADALARLKAVSGRMILDSAQLALARHHGFASWPELKLEVDRRRILDTRDMDGLGAMLAAHPEQAVQRLRNWSDHPRGASPLGYVAMLRYDTSGRRWRDLPGTGPVAEALLAAGAPVEGDPADPETPLMTAASYGDAEVARVLVEAGADTTATAEPWAGGVPGGTALRHAAVFGMADVAEVLVAAGARDLVHAAAVGDLSGMLTADTPVGDRVAALRIAAERGQLEAIDRLLAVDTPVDGVDVHGSTALHAAAFRGRAAGVRHLLAHGADPARRDTRFGTTPLRWCRHQREAGESSQGHEEVEQLLAPVTPDQT